MGKVSHTDLHRVKERAARIQEEYDKAKTEYTSAKKRLKWIFAVKECKHDIERTDFEQLITYQCKKCKYIWYD